MLPNILLIIYLQRRQPFTCFCLKTGEGLSAKKYHLALEEASYCARI